MPWQNQSWHTTLYITSTGYSTNSIPYAGKIFQIDLNFQTHQLIIKCSGKAKSSMDLPGKTVADFYSELMANLHHLGIQVQIYAAPNEIAPAIPFDQNTTQFNYDREAAFDLWQAMLRANEVFAQFRGEFLGKSSPVHLFWGGFDLAVTRFSGRAAPVWEGTLPPNMPLSVMQEAYSQEVSSAGFWPGSREFPHPMFYAYAYPTPKEYATQDILPDQASYSTDMGEFVLPYNEVQKAEDPNAMLLEFLRSTYQAAASTANWDQGLVKKPD